MSIFKTIEQLASTNSRLAKEEILRNNLTDSLLKEVIRITLDPFTQFYIRKIPAYKNTEISSITLSDAIKKLGDLSSRKFTGHAAIDHLKSILEGCDIHDAKVVERIIAKDLKCGVSDATANKIWPGLVPDYPCMLASGFDEKLINKIKWPAFVQHKLDGMRFNAIVRDGKVEFRSRNGKELTIPNAAFSVPFVKLSEAYGKDMVFDGELLVVDEKGKPVNRQTGNGILSKSIKGTMQAEDAQNIRATLWDAVGFDSFLAGVEKTPYKDRLYALASAIQTANDGVSHLQHYIELVYTREVDNLSKAEEIFEKFLAKGEEGIILKTKDAIWEGKRSKQQIKFKGELECDLICVDWEEGTGKNVGRLGALVLESACGELRTNVGTGFTDSHRQEFTKEKVVGKIVTVKYNSKIKDRGGNTWALFLPVFIELRDDKNIADLLDKIK
jgi:hypothetical protein